MPEIQFKGKEFVFNHHLSVPYRPLVPHKDKSIGAGNINENLVIHGDNLHALKALMPMYAGKIDCIFIDPPYNTGNEGWAYNDNVNSPMIKEWLNSNPIAIDDALRHDKWCSMIFPRLRLLYELLSEKGSIFISIDHNEAHHLKMLLDEIFGEDNFVASIAWQKRTSPEARKKLGPAHDTIYVYAKSKSDLNLSKLTRTDEQLEDFSNPDDDPNGDWASSDMTAQNPDPTKRKDQQYKIELPSGEMVDPPPGRCWSMLEPEYLKLKNANRIWFGVNGSARPRIKTYLSETEGVSSWTWWPNNEVGHNQEAKKEILEILGADKNFDYPKPVRLLSRILEIATTKDAIVLDSFAGSGTTAHAVLQANRKDNGQRKFILVECENYADTITAERVRRVINGYSFKGTQKEVLYTESISFTSLKKSNKILDQIASIENLEKHRFDKIKKEIKSDTLTVIGEKKITEQVDGTGGSFTYCTLGEPIDIDKILTGENLPDYQSIGSWLFHTATGEALNVKNIKEKEFLLGESNAYCVWLIYKPELEFLKSRDSALTLAFAEKIASNKNKKHLVFAPAKFVPNKSLLPLGVEYAPLPFALYRVEK